MLSNPCVIHVNKEGLSEQASGGRLKLNLLPKAVASPPGTFDAIRDGLADISYTVHGYTAGRFVLTKVAEFSLLGDSAEAVSVAYQRVYERHLARADEHKGVKVLAVFAHGPGHVLTARKPINTLDDLRGMKLRVAGGFVLDLSNQIGVTAVVKPGPETYELLSQGVVDGTFLPLEALASFRLEKVIRNVTMVPGGMYNTSFVMMMNEARFNALSRQDQDAIMSVSGERLARHAGRVLDEKDRTMQPVISANNTAVIHASPAFVAALAAKSRMVEEAWGKEAQARGVDGLKALTELREEARRPAVPR